MADIYEPTGAVPVKIEVKNNRRLLDTPVAKPGVIRVKTEDLQRKSFEIRAKVIGKLPKDTIKEHLLFHRII